MIAVQQIIYTPQNIFDMFVTPQIALAAPPVGYVNNILGITHKMTFNTIAYFPGTAMLYARDSNQSTVLFGSTDLLASEFDYNINLVMGDHTRGIYSTTDALLVSTQSQESGGNSNITAFIIYEQILLT